MAVVQYFSDRVMKVRLRGDEKDLVIMQVYLPTNQYPEEEIDERKEMIEEDKKVACLKVMVDWNAVAIIQKAFQYLKVNLSSP